MIPFFLWQRVVFVGEKKKMKKKGEKKGERKEPWLLFWQAARYVAVGSRERCSLPHPHVISV